MPRKREAIVLILTSSEAARVASRELDAHVSDDEARRWGIENGLPRLGGRGPLLWTEQDVLAFTKDMRSALDDEEDDDLDDEDEDDAEEAEEEDDDE
jgi:hypothetical protein